MGCNNLELRLARHFSQCSCSTSAFSLCYMPTPPRRALSMLLSYHPITDSYCLILDPRLHEKSSLFSWFSLKLRQALCSLHLKWRFFSMSTFFPWQPNSVLPLWFILGRVSCPRIVVVNQGLVSLWDPETRLLSYSSTGLEIFFLLLFS